MKQLSPSEHERIEQFIKGPQLGEDRNIFMARMNGLLTEGDRQYIVELMDYVNSRAPDHDPR